MTILARLAPQTAVKAAGVSSISSDGTYIVANTLRQLGMYFPTAAGVRVTNDAALGLPTLYAAIKALSEDVAKLPLILYRRREDDGRDRASDHPLYRVFKNKPNPQMTSFSWREAMMRSLLLWGNGYNEITEDQLGRTQIWPIDAARVEIVWEDDAKAFYYYDRQGGKKRLADGTVMHVPGPSDDGLIGVSLVESMRSALGEAIATREFGTSFYRNGARPGFIMEHPSTLSAGAIERLATQIDALRGSTNAGKTIIAEEGLKAHEIGVAPEQAQYTETRKLQREDIATMARTPQHKVGILDHGTYSNVEQESLNYYQDAILSWTSRIEQAIDAFFFEDEEDELYVEHLLDFTLRADVKTRSEALKVQREGGVLTKHQWQRIENRNPTGEDDVWVPASNYTAVPVDADGNVIEEPAPVTDAQPDATQPPQLVAVKSAGPVRCEADFRGAKCGRVLADLAVPPYRIPCPRCKAVAEAA